MARLRLNLNLVNTSVSVERTNRLDGHNFATTIMRDVGLKYSASRYSALKQKIASEIRPAIEREIRNIAKQYEALIVGAGGQRQSRPMLTSAAKVETISGRVVGSSRLDFQRPKWAPLTDNYVRWKKRNGLTPNFWLAKTRHLGDSMARGDTWTEIFGPVSIRVSSQRGVEERAIPTIRDNNIRSRGAKVEEMHFAVAKIEVRALGAITAAMLPALKSANYENANINFSGHDGRTNGLIGLVAQHDEELGYRLGGRMTTPYRATLEPFLGFVLTRAIPAAVHQRVLSLVK